MIAAEADTEGRDTARNVTERREHDALVRSLPQDAIAFTDSARRITNGAALDLGSPRRAPGTKDRSVLPSVV